jgi:hypothetical protein
MKRIERLHGLKTLPTYLAIAKRRYAKVDERVLKSRIAEAAMRNWPALCTVDFRLVLR